MKKPEKTRAKPGPKPRSIAVESVHLPGGIIGATIDAPTREARRSPFSFRMLDELREKLAPSAARKRRALSEEIEARLWQSLHDEEQFGDRESQFIGHAVARRIRWFQKELGEGKVKNGGALPPIVRAYAMPRSLK